RMGHELAAESPVDADMVIPLPDSGTPAAIGYAEASGIPFREGLTKSRYINRTFIQPDQSLREAGVVLKLNPLRRSISGKRVIAVDDSIVRGTTSRRIIDVLRRAGAREIHLRISSPPMRFPCFMGVDIGPYNRMLGALRETSQATHGPEVVAGVGPFAGLFELPGGGRLAASTDSVGTKVKVAIAAGRHDRIGFDLVNHCLNDIATA